MSLYDQDHIRNFYNNYATLETARWDKSIVEKVKLHVHQHFLHQHINQGESILELGAGTGVFTKLLANYTADLIVTDLSPVQLNLNKESAEKAGYASKIKTWELIDICDLSKFEDASFDKVVCYGGPLSYVFDQKVKALKEIKRVLKPKGKAFIGVMNLWGTVNEYLTKIILPVPKADNEKVMKTGNLHPSAFTASDHHCHMFTAEELKSDLQQVGFKIITLSASNCLSASRPEEVEAIQNSPEKWEYFLDLELRACQSSGMIESGTHLIAVVEA